MTEDVCRSVVVIPVHNEAPTIGAIVAAASRYLSVLVVDDASHDGSGALAAAAGARVVTLAKHCGKGEALRRGFAEALRSGAGVVITLDGDGQHDPHDIPRFVAASRRWSGGLIVGDRLETTVGIPRHRLYAMQISSFWINWLGGCTIRDTQSGFRVYPARLLKTLPLRHGGFLLESEILIKAGRAGHAIHAIPIRAVYPPGQRSHYRPVRDGALAAFYLFYCSVCWWPRQLGHLVYRSTLASPHALQQARHHVRVVACATGLLPVLCLLVLVQLCLGRLGVDVVAPLVRRFYDQRILHPPSAFRNVFP